MDRHSPTHALSDPVMQNVEAQRGQIEASERLAEETAGLQAALEQSQVTHVCRELESGKRQSETERQAERGEKRRGVVRHARTDSDTDRLRQAR